MRPVPHWTTVAIAMLIVVFLLAPLIATIPVSFTSERFLSMPNGNWSLRHYEKVFTDPGWLGAIRTSALVALVAGTLATILAGLFCVGIWLARPWGAAALVGIVLAPMAIPPIISSLALYFFVSRAGLQDSLPGVILAHVVMATPFAVVILMVALSLVDRRNELAARNLGASLGQTVAWVILPQIRGALISAWFLSFMLSWEEISVTLFVSGYRIVTLPRQIWSGLRDNVDPAIAVASAVMIVLTAAALLVRALWKGFHARPGRRPDA